MAVSIPSSTSVTIQSLTPQLISYLRRLLFALVGLCVVVLVVNFGLDFMAHSNVLGDWRLTNFEPNWFLFAGLLSITALIGFLLVDGENLSRSDQDNGPSVRRALVGTIVIAYFAFLAAIFNCKTPLTPETLSLFDGLGKLVTIIVTFYFGASTLQNTVKIVSDNMAKTRPDPVTPTLDPTPVSIEIQPTS